MDRITYEVFSAAPGQFQAVVDMGGTPAQVMVDGFIVELVSTDGAMTHTLKLRPADMDAAKAEYVVGRTYTGQFQPLGD